MMSYVRRRLEMKIRDRGHQLFLHYKKLKQKLLTSYIFRAILPRGDPGRENWRLAPSTRRGDEHRHMCVEVSRFCPDKTAGSLEPACSISKHDHVVLASASDWLDLSSRFFTPRDIRV